MPSTEQIRYPLTALALTDKDFRRAIKVISSINRVDQWPEDTWWTPNQLEEVAKRVKEFTVRRQVKMAADVIRRINRHHGACDDEGYPQQSLQAIAADPALHGFALLPHDGST